MYYITHCPKCNRYASFFTSDLNKYTFVCYRCRHSFKLRQKGSFVTKIIGGFKTPIKLNEFVSYYNSKHICSKQ